MNHSSLRWVRRKNSMKMTLQYRFLSVVELFLTEASPLKGWISSSKETPPISLLWINICIPTSKPAPSCSTFSVNLAESFLSRPYRLTLSQRSSFNSYHHRVRIWDYLTLQPAASVFPHLWWGHQPPLRKKGKQRPISMRLGTRWGHKSQ